MKKTKRMIILCLVMLVSSLTLISAAPSGPIAIRVPSWGASSGPVNTYETKDDNYTFGGMRLVTQGSKFAMWGNLHLDKHSKKAMVSDIELKYDYKFKDYYASEFKYKGKYYPSASSSNYEPNAGTITVEINT